jgi:hypothetical protein
VEYDVAGKLMYSRKLRAGSLVFSSTSTVPDFFAENEACRPGRNLNRFTASVSSETTSRLLPSPPEDVDVSPLFRSIVITPSFTTASSLAEEEEEEARDEEANPSSSNKEEEEKKTLFFLPSKRRVALRANELVVDAVAATTTLVILLYVWSVRAQYWMCVLYVCVSLSLSLSRE